MNKILKLSQAVTALTFVMVAVACFAHADPSDGKDEGFKVCSAMTYESDKEACMKIVAQSKFFNVDAIKVCTLSPYPSDVDTCLGLVKDQYYTTDLIAVCAKFTYESDRESCMKLVAGKRAYPVAVSGCAKSPYPSDVMACLQTVLTPYVPDPTPTPSPMPTPYPPIPTCDKNYVITQFDQALELLKNYKVMDAFQQFLQLESYLKGCLQ